MFNIINHVLGINRDSQDGETIYNNLKQIAMLNSEQFFVDMEMYFKNIIPIIHENQ